MSEKIFIPFIFLVLSLALSSLFGQGKIVTVTIFDIKTIFMLIFNPLG